MINNPNFPIDDHFEVTRIAENEYYVFYHADVENRTLAWKLLTDVIIRDIRMLHIHSTDVDASTTYIGFTPRDVVGTIFMWYEYYHVNTVAASHYETMSLNMRDFVVPEGSTIMINLNTTNTERIYMRVRVGRCNS